LKKQSEKRLAWAITGSGHFLRESISIIESLEKVDLFLSAAADEVIKQYGYTIKADRVFKDKTASSVPVEFFYQGHYHTLVIAPATSNTIAKMAYGISDSLVTNLYAQAGKTRVPSIVFACDTDEELDSEAPKENIVKVYPRRIDLDNITKIKLFEETTVVEDMNGLSFAIQARLKTMAN
jgi:dihydromethanopterin reductase (acceptor)